LGAPSSKSPLVFGEKIGVAPKGGRVLENDKSWTLPLKNPDWRFVGKTVEVPFRSDHAPPGGYFFKIRVSVDSRLRRKVVEGCLTNHNLSAQTTSKSLLH
jgi:hypothetical protein